MDRFAAGHDPAAVLAPEAVAELTALLETVPDPVADIEVASAAGLLHWFRSLVLGPGHNEQDLRAALTLFLPVYRVRPDAVPTQVRTHFGRVEASVEPFAVAQRAVTLLREALGTADRGGLDAAIDLLGVAVAAIPGDDPDRAKLLSNLGIALHARFEQARDLADLDAEIDARRQVVAASPAGDPGRAADLSSLGEALLARFIRVGDRADVDAAVDTLRRAVAATPAGHPDSIARLFNLGGALQERFQRVGDRADLDAAIDLLRQALAASPADHPGRAMMLSNLGMTLQTRF